MYQIQMQFIPGNDDIWVSKLNPEDELIEFTNEIFALVKLEELQATDHNGRKYKIIYL